ncbi:MAG: hypothetical protein HXY45_09735 [Syntrophaceae bacterium]|jgi:hypothetical protein|nr:hypothetical protein [Syntrophaceae bacterium]
MKVVKKVNRDRIRKALRAVYYEKEKVELAGDWQSRVMGQIQTLGPLNLTGNYFELFEHLLWRLAPAVCVLVFVLSIALFSIDFVPAYEIAGWLTEDPAEFSLLELFS